MPLLAAWTQPGHVVYYDLDCASLLREQQHEDLNTRQPEQWRQQLDSLRAPDGSLPTVIPAADRTLHLSQDGQLRLDHLQSGELALLADGRESRINARLLAVGLNPAGSLIGGLDGEGYLHLYQRSVPVGRFDIGLKGFAPRLPAAVLLRQDRVFVVHGRQIIETDPNGKVVKTQELHYPIGAFAVSADGQHLACCDRDTSVIRVYDSAAMTPRYQRHAEDLIAKATQVQLLADLPPRMVVLNSLAINDRGVLAFALAGVVCVTDTTQMNVLPQ